MRKAEKRRLGEERARSYLAREQARQAEWLRLANQIRAEKAARAADDAKRKNNRKKNRKAVKDMASIEMECI
jgi:hypothetical protein